MARRGQNTSEERAAAARERLGQLGDQLTAAVSAIQSSDDFRRYLRMQARFHAYSWRNTMAS